MRVWTCNPGALESAQPLQLATTYVPVPLQRGYYLNFSGLVRFEGLDLIVLESNNQTKPLENQVQ
jgi:hypothetical protein